MTTHAPAASPYLDGTFEGLLGTLDPEPNMAALETNRGCPFACTFCDWGQATRSAVYELPMERVCAELDWIGEHRIPFLYVIDANFGIRRRDEAIVEHIARVHARTGYPRFCYFHMTKNAEARNLRTMEILQDAGIDSRMALSMQDFEPRVLAAIERSNIDPDHALALRQRCSERGIETFNELILGLPEQTYASFCNSVIAATTPYPGDSFSLYPCQLLEGSEMASPEHRQRFGLETVRCVTAGADPAIPAYVDEVEEFVVGTSAMPREDWRQAFRFGYLVAAIYHHPTLRAWFQDMRFRRGVDMVRWVNRLLQACDQASPQSAAGGACRSSFAVTWRPWKLAGRCCSRWKGWESTGFR